jgi:hypothetical protein
MYKVEYQHKSSETYETKKQAVKNIRIEMKIMTGRDRIYSAKDPDDRIWIYSSLKSLRNDTISNHRSFCTLEKL